MVQARLEDHRRQKAEQEAQQGERELIRQRVRGQLEARTRWLKASPEGTLRALGITVDMEPRTFRADLAKTVRKARLQYHPDRHQVSFTAFSMDATLSKMEIRGTSAEECDWERACKMLSPCMIFVHLLAGRHSASPSGGRGDFQDHIHHKDLRGLQSAICTYLWPQPMRRGLHCQAVVLKTHLHPAVHRYL